MSWRWHRSVTPEQRAKVERSERTKNAQIGGLVRAGHLEEALYLYSSRKGLAVVSRWLRQGRSGLRPLLAIAWSAGEPDDTDPAYVTLWRRIAAGERIEDGGTLPSGDPLTVYRGQATDDEPLGMSWSLDPDVADWFALRFFRDVGTVFTGTVPRGAVLGYLNERDEAEVVLDPNDVTLTGSRLADPRAKQRRMDGGADAWGTRAGEVTASVGEKEAGRAGQL